MKIRDKREKNWFWTENALIDRGDLTIYEKMIYMVFCRFSDNEGKSFPSLATLAERAGCSRRKVSETVRKLEEKNLIHKKSRMSSAGDPSSNLYFLFSAGLEGGIAQGAIPSARGAIGVVHGVHTNNTNINSLRRHTSERVCLLKIKKLIKNTSFEFLKEVFLERVGKKYGTEKVFQTLEILVFQNSQPKNPGIFLESCLLRGVVPPPGFISAGARAEAEKKKEEEKTLKRGEMEKIRAEEMPEEAREFLRGFRAAG